MHTIIRSALFAAALDDVFVPDAQQALKDLSNQSIRERTDAEQDEPEGVHEDAQNERDPYPQFNEWWQDDFVMRSSADGRQFLAPQRKFVDALIQSAPIRLDRAYQLLGAEDRAMCEAVAKDIKSASELLTTLDTFQAEQLFKYFPLQAARQAARAASLRWSAVKWKARLKTGQEEPERLTNLINLVPITAKTGAFMLHIARQLTPDVKVDYRSACWDTARINANNIQKRILDPKAKGNAEQSASHALLDNC